MPQFLLIRHGQADYDLAELRRARGMGRDLVPLTPEGVSEIDRAAERLPVVSLLPSSPLTRALGVPAKYPGAAGSAGVVCHGGVIEVLTEGSVATGYRAEYGVAE